MIDNWGALQAACVLCTRCGLCEGRTNVVFGMGNPGAEVLFVGEGPGRDEDLQGKPFVGRSGQLLDKFLAAVGLHRDRVYIANIVKCRPPENRDPRPDEQEACIGWLRNQFYLMRPKIVVCLGRVAAMKMIDPEIKITRQHGEFTDKNGTLFMGTFHPAALLRNPKQKPDAFGDYTALRDKILEICTRTPVDEMQPF